MCDAPRVASSRVTATWALALEAALGAELCRTQQTLWPHHIIQHNTSLRRVWLVHTPPHTLVSSHLWAYNSERWETKSTQRVSKWVWSRLQPCICISLVTKSSPERYLWRSAVGCILASAYLHNLSDQIRSKVIYKWRCSRLHLHNLNPLQRDIYEAVQLDASLHLHTCITLVTNSTPQWYLSGGASSWICHNLSD